MVTAEDLVLARACVDGDEQAWERFVARYRGPLFAAALAMTKDNSRARELADSLWAELFGTRVDATGQRRSKLASYTGSGSLEGWLRAMLAQECVNLYRQQRRFVTLEGQTQTDCSSREDALELVATDARLGEALEKALAELKPEERLILASQYLDGRTLAETGKMLGLHESTVSRRLKKSTNFLRKRTIHYLRRSGMSMKEVEELMAVDVCEIALDLREHLTGVKNAV